MLKAGDKAPSFKLKCDQGEWISTASLKNKSYVVYFYPKDDTPGCTKEACSFRDLHRQFARLSIPVFGVSKDPVLSHQSFREKFSLPFPLLSDPDLEVAKKFGAWGEKNMYGKKSMGLIRSTFVVGADGKIVKAYRVRDAQAHPQRVLEDVLAALI